MSFQVHDLVYLCKEGRIAKVISVESKGIMIDSRLYSLNDIVLLFSAGGKPEENWGALDQIKRIRQIFDVLVARHARYQQILSSVYVALARLSKLGGSDTAEIKKIMGELTISFDELSGLCNLCIAAIEEIDLVFNSLSLDFLLDYPGIKLLHQSLAGLKKGLDANPSSFNDLFPKGYKLGPH